jgi:phage gpG-like protein
MRVETRTEGTREWGAALHLMTRRVEVATHQATRRVGHTVERAVKLYLRTYTHPAGTPTPAPPGGPPALVSGDLMRSVRSTPVTLRRRGVYEVAVGPTRIAPYLRIQERGGRAGRNHSVRLPARPYQKPTTRRQLATIKAICKQHWREATRL